MSEKPKRSVKETTAEKLVKEMIIRKGDEKADQQILDHYRKNKRR